MEVKTLIFHMSQTHGFLWKVETPPPSLDNMFEVTEKDSDFSTLYFTFSLF